MIHYHEKSGVGLMNCTLLKEVKEGKAVVVRNVPKTVPDPYDTWTSILPENLENPFARKILMMKEKWK